MNKEKGLTLIEIMIGVGVLLLVVGVGVFVYTQKQTFTDQPEQNQHGVDGAADSSQMEENSSSIDIGASDITGNPTIEIDAPIVDFGKNATWSTYTNDSFGYSVSIPPLFDQIIEKDDSTSFLYMDGDSAVILAFFEVKADNLTREQVAQRIDEITEDKGFSVGTVITPGAVDLTKIKSSIRSDCGAQWRYGEVARPEREIAEYTVVIVSCLNGERGYSLTLETRGGTSGGETSLELLDRFLADFEKALASLSFS